MKELGPFFGHVKSPYVNGKQFEGVQLLLRQVHGDTSILRACHWQRGGKARGGQGREGRWSLVSRKRVWFKGVCISGKSEEVWDYVSDHHREPRRGLVGSVSYASSGGDHKLS